MNKNLVLYCMFLRDLSNIMRDIQDEDLGEEESIDFIDKELEDLDSFIEKLNLTILLHPWSNNDCEEYIH